MFEDKATFFSPCTLHHLPRLYVKKDVCMHERTSCMGSEPKWSEATGCCYSYSGKLVERGIEWEKEENRDKDTRLNKKNSKHVPRVK